ncbi:flagellar brake protein [Methylococcus sp. EFPC2]|uniref:flagellar brake protein n=1 Tax=Methylococcus sp. EFPC2 TaxID=2812648 RepID=UPI0019677B31|nr:flagellar brake protein [Methylococcus sp. EFPC2]QSA98921.1 flagellar brake protein [Methylococcus sp. EFPC2]
MMPPSDLIKGYTLFGKGEILEKLRIIETRRILLSSSVAGSNTGFLTLIVKILPEKGLMAVDTSANEGLNRSLVDAEEVSFACRVDGIEARFSVGRVKEASINGQDVFAVPLPDRLYWLQRRRCYRAYVPQAMRVTCHIPLAGREPAELEVLDISLDGLGLSGFSEQFSAEPEVGQRFENCLLLPRLAGEPATIEIRSKLATTVGHRPAFRLGCSMSSRSRGFQVQIQKLLYDLEMHKKKMDQSISTGVHSP